MPRNLTTFTRNEDGTVLVFWAISLVVLIGVVSLSFDVGRMAVTQTDLQSYADHVALAAAGELDGASDAITRARAAAQDLISDTQHYGDGASALSADVDVTLSFHSDLPSDDLSALGSVTADPAEAAFVAVDITPRSVDTPFADTLATMLGVATPSATVNARAVAGFTRYACDITPLFFCVPPGFDADSARGEMIHLRSGGGVVGQWGAGNYGFLSPSSGIVEDPSGPCAGEKGGNLERCLLAAQSPVTTCFAQRGVDLSPGQSTGNMAAALNVRFDLFDATMNSHQSDPEYGPAPNVVSGHAISAHGHSGKCTVDDSTDTVPLPRDDCMASGTCERFGDGDFGSGLATYVGTNYDVTPGWYTDYLGGTISTRYEIYKAEIDAAAGGDILTGRSETGLPGCGIPSSDPERRVLVAAGIDCAANAINGAKTGVPVDQYVRVFLTEPADANTKDIFVEVLGSAEAGAGAGIIQDVVQLYR
jgi:Flp pilus assembly protein TadG